jgi:hypothetical protein
MVCHFDDSIKCKDNTVIYVTMDFSDRPSLVGVSVVSSCSEWDERGCHRNTDRR